MKMYLWEQILRRFRKRGNATCETTANWHSVVTQRHVWHKNVNAGKSRSDVNNLQVVWQPNIYSFELSEISSISVTSGGDRNRIGGPHVPLPLLT